MESTTKIWLKLSLPGQLHYFFRPQVSQSVIEAEALWASFVVEHNLALNASDHATLYKLFPKLYLDSEVAKKLACGRTTPLLFH